MAGCILRIEGTSLKAPGSLRTSSTRYGLVASIGRSNATFQQQLKSASAFLRKHKKALGQVARSKGFRSTELDFGVWNRAPEVVAQFHAFPASFISLAAACGVGLSISVYASDRSGR